MSMMKPATDNDSAFGEGSESDTTSIASSILNYTYENGRRYSAQGAEHYVSSFFKRVDRVAVKLTSLIVSAQR